MSSSPHMISLKRSGLAVTVILLVIIAAPAHANQWLVYTGGDRPNRTFTVIDEDYISPEFNSDTSFKVEAATIYEAPSQPDWSTATIMSTASRRRCASILSRSARATAHYAAGRTLPTIRLPTSPNIRS